MMREVIRAGDRDGDGRVDIKDLKRIFEQLNDEQAEITPGNSSQAKTKKRNPTKGNATNLTTFLTMHL